MRHAKNGFSLAAALFVPLLLTGCGAPVIDPTDVEGSIAKLRDSLDDEQQVAFDAAIALVREAGAGKVAGTDAFALDGMTAAAVLAEAERIGIRRERTGEQALVAAHRERLDAEEKLTRLRVTGFAARPVGDTEMEADLTVENGLGFPVDTAWLEIRVEIPDGAAVAGEEFVPFQPALAPGESRTVRVLVLGAEARSLPVEPPAELTTRFRMVERDREVVLQAPSPEERRDAEAAIAAAQARIAALTARLAAVETPE
ncbi:MAG: hypothetical protein F9K16_04205 [Thermoanaerobaculia bacterium]|nr:MAG: hypothetical protein F9K16_04205 [Thermoanaerobaculia bacterium]MBZ0103298.1 hypothetical protein [Thermoanaerobaculia bacterium]